MYLGKEGMTNAELLLYFGENVKRTDITIPTHLHWKDELVTTECRISSRVSLSYNEKHWSNEADTMALLNKIINPYVTEVKEELGLPETQKALLIWDAFRAQSTDNVMRELEKLNIKVVTVPKNMTQLTHLSRR